MRLHLDLVQSVTVADMHATRQILRILDVGERILYGTKSVQVASTGIETRNELHAIVGVGKGDMMTVRRHERGRQVVAILEHVAHIAVQVLFRFEHVLREEAAHHVRTLNVVVVVVHEHLVAFSELEVESTAVGSHRCRDAYPWRCQTFDFGLEIRIGGIGRFLLFFQGLLFLVLLFQ